MSTATPDIQSTNGKHVKLESSEPATDSQPQPAPETVLMQFALGALSAQAVHAAAKLGVADMLSDGPRSAEELAWATDTDPASLYRVMRALSSFGIFVEQENQVFALTPAAEPLRSDTPNSLRDLTIFMREEWHLRVWGNLLHSVRTGKPAWEQVHGKEVFPYLAANPEASNIFDKAMTSLSSPAIKRLHHEAHHSRLG